MVSAIPVCTVTSNGISNMPLAHLRRRSRTPGCQCHQVDRHLGAIASIGCPCSNLNSSLVQFSRCDEACISQKEELSC